MKSLKSTRVILILITAISISLSAFALGQKGDFPLSKVLTRLLEGHHYLARKVDDTISQRAFKLILKRLDYRKQFFTQEDLKDLKKSQDKLDDQFVAGDTVFIKKAFDLLLKRVAFAEGLTKKYLSKPFNFDLDQNLETDYEKREFVKTDSELESRWKKTLKYMVLNQLLTLEKEQKEEIKNQKTEKKKTAKKKKKKTKKKKRLSFSELEAQARKSVQEDHDSFFKRLKDMKEIDKQSIFANSITTAFDPHTSYLAPRDNEDFNLQMSNQLEGIGALLSQDGPYTKVERIIPGSPSWNQKELKSGDIILKVGQGEKEPVSIVGMDLRESVNLIRGEKQTEVRLTVRTPEGTQKVIAIIRDVVELEEGRAKAVILEHSQLKGKKIGYISLPSFYRDFNAKKGQPARNCTDDVRSLITKLMALGISGLMLDVRNNGGGSLQDSIDIAGLFIDQGPVVQVKESKGVQIHRDRNPGALYSGPLLVLQNTMSASASEILSAALIDYGRAVVVGTKTTHGKGSVQQVIDLDRTIGTFLISSLLGKVDKKNRFGAFKMTIQQFYRINGSSTQKKGVSPHIILPDTLEYLDSGESHLDYAMDWNRISGVKYKPWTKKSYKISDLRRKSQKRVRKSKALQKIAKKADYLKKISDETTRPLNLAKLKARRKQEEQDLKKFKIDEINKDIVVADYFSNEIYKKKKISKSNAKRLKKENEAKQKEFRERVQKDPLLEEAIFITADMVKSLPST